jgi:hypothetical protein
MSCFFTGSGDVIIIGGSNACADGRKIGTSSQHLVYNIAKKVLLKTGLSFPKYGRREALLTTKQLID